MLGRFVHRSARKALIALCAVVAGCSSEPPPPPPDLLIEATRVVDVATGESGEPVDIAVRDGMIQAVSQPGEGPRPDSATRVVDGSGTWTLPGLHDMHTHLWNRDMLAGAYLDHGITTVRDMGGAGGGWDTWEAEADSIPVPRALNGAFIVDGIQSVFFFFAEARDSAAAAAAVADVADAGADFVKVYTRLSRSAFMGAAVAAKEAGLPLAGHVPAPVRASEAVARGLESIEHFTGIALECSTREENLRDRITGILAPLQADSLDPELLSGPLGEAYRLERWEALDSYDPAACSELMGQIERGEVWLTPTLVVTGDGADGKRDRVEPHLASWPAWMHGMMAPPDDLESYATPDRLAALRELFLYLNGRGARWLAGSDAPNPGSAPGIGLHHELELLVDYGLSPAEALRAATLDAAEFAGTAEVSGSVETGKQADLVLVSGDPLEVISNTQLIESVVLRGRVVR